MNLHSLRYFIEVAKTLNFTKASENLFVSQPGISQQIHLLEEQIGVKLLHRTTRKVELTEEGKYLFEKTFPSLTKIESIISSLTESNVFPTQIKIATIPSAASLYLPGVVKELHEHDPNIEFSIKETASADVVKLIKDKTYHLGFIRTTANSQIIKDEGIKYLEFEHSPMKAVVSSKHRFANRKSIKINELQDDFFLHYDPKQSTALYQLLEEICNNAGFSPKTICTGSELLTISNIISNNLGVTLMPKDMLELVLTPEIHVLDLEDVSSESSIVAIWSDDGYLNINTKILIQVLERLLNIVEADEDLINNI